MGNVYQFRQIATVIKRSPRLEVIELNSVSFRMLVLLFGFMMMQTHKLTDPCNIHIGSRYKNAMLLLKGFPIFCIHG